MKSNKITRTTGKKGMKPMNELDNCLKKIDEILKQIADINYKLAEAKLVSDIETHMAVKEAERIVNDCYSD